MSLPPEDDDRYDDVLRQVSEALSAIGLRDGETRESLLAGVRDALHTLLDDPDEDPPGPPRVVVYDGEGEAPERVDGPELRVVDTEEAERILGGPIDEARVRVLHAGPRSPGLSAEGRLRGAWSDGERPWQTVYRGEIARGYRLACDAGTLELAVDGVTIERVRAGQTVDVEGRAIRVRTAGTTEATGRYVRL